MVDRSFPRDSMLKPWFGCHVIVIHLIINIMDFSPLPDRWVLGQPPDLVQPFWQMLDGLTAFAHCPCMVEIPPLPCTRPK